MSNDSDDLINGSVFFWGAKTTNIQWFQHLKCEILIMIGHNRVFEDVSLRFKTF